jgi:hypothetical protein
MIKKSPGLSVRFLNKAVDGFTNINKELGGPSVNRLLQRMMIESLTLGGSSTFTIGRETPFLSGIRANFKLRKQFADVAEMLRTREISRSDAQVVDLPVHARHRAKLTEIAGKLDWSLTQVVVGALYTFAILASSQEVPKDLPLLLKNLRAIKHWEAELQKEKKNKLSAEPTPLVPMEVLVDLL